MSSPPSHRSTLRDFLASIATIRGDLSDITAPPFVLATKSTTEFPQYWAEQPAIFAAPASEPDPQKRALLVLRWFLASLKGQQYAGRKVGEGIKKPLNAFLGELFIARWEREGDEDDGGVGETRLICEQVSHHPPVTACYLWNDTQGIRATGYTRQEITLSNFSVHIHQTGHAILHIDRYDEDYLIPLPSVTIKGILSGSPYPELHGTYHIISTNGFTSEIDFSGRGFFSGGKKNSFTARLYEGIDRENPLYTVQGQWSDQFTFEDLQAGQEIETYDTNVAKPRALIVDPLDQQDPWESRRAWSGVIDALNRGDMGATSREKGMVEQGQRDMRKVELAEGRKWRQVFFESLEGDVLFERLAHPIGLGIQSERTKGVWRVKRDALEKVRKPFHAEITPVTYLGRGKENGTSRQSMDGGDVSRRKSSASATSKGWFRRRSHVELDAAANSKTPVDVDGRTTAI